MNLNVFNKKKNKENNEFLAGIDNMEKLEEATKQLNKDVKKLISNANLYNKSVSKLNTDLTSEFDLKSSNNTEAIKHFDVSVSKQEQIIREMITGYDQTLCAPMKKYATIFPSFDDAVKKREKAFSEFQKLSEKLQKHEEQRKLTNTLKIEKLKKEIKPIKEEYQLLNKKLLEEVPRFYNNRINYLFPSFAALVDIQNFCLQETLKCTETNYDEVSNESDKTVEEILNEIRTLDITYDK